MSSSSPGPSAAEQAAALVVAGMHRSGTSFVASLAERSGIHMGDELMPAEHGNARGHFEDLAFYDLHKRALAGNGLHVDGFTTQADIVMPEPLVDEAGRLVRMRREAGRAWGWKEPRTVLFLDFWATLVPEARYLFVFRRPWEVVDSLYRRGDVPTSSNPGLAIDVWLAYNRRLSRFLARFPERCLLVELTQFVEEPETVAAAIRGRLGVPFSIPPAVFEPRLLRADQGSHRAALLRDVAPEACDLYLELRAAAGSRSALPVGLAPETEPIPTRQAAAMEWARTARAEEGLGVMAAELSTAKSAADSAAETLLATRHELAAALEEIGDLRCELGAAVARAEAAEAAHADLVNAQECLGTTREELAATRIRLEESLIRVAKLEKRLAPKTLRMRLALETKRLLRQAHGLWQAGWSRVTAP